MLFPSFTSFTYIWFICFFFSVCIYDRKFRSLDTFNFYVFFFSFCTACFFLNPSLWKIINKEHEAKKLPKISKVKEAPWRVVVAAAVAVVVINAWP